MRGEAIRDGGGGGTAFYFQGMERDGVQLQVFYAGTTWTPFWW